MKKLMAFLAILSVITFALAACKNETQAPTAPESTAKNESTSDFVFIQYCIYAPETAAVALDGKSVDYNESINCFEAYLSKEGTYTLTISHEGCEPIEEKVNITMAEHEYTAELVYSDSHIDSAQENAARLVESLMKKCWSLDYSLEEFSFSSEEDRLRSEENMADAVSALEENLSAEYTVGAIDISLTPSLSGNSDKPLGTDEDDTALFFAFDAQYSYPWHFKSDSYENSGEMTKKSKPYIFIEKIDGKWCIKSFHIDLSNTDF
ncbi:MAG: hypothetical protein IKB94_00795 [Clostridia bacterium]|nr:hypothetical protein [Clostridia bacterium]